jgi:hypothetical protein
MSKRVCRTTTSVIVGTARRYMFSSLIPVTDNHPTIKSPYKPKNIEPYSVMSKQVKIGLKSYLKIIEP